MPSARHAVMAGIPSTVAGILMNRFGLFTSHRSALASAIVLRVSPASPGSTSSETRPSSPPVASKTGWNTSQAQRMSKVVMARDASSTDTPRTARSAICSS